MRLETGWSDFPSDGRTCVAFRARPAATGERLPGILLIQEIWGVDDHIQDLTGRVATAGYVALAPDLYSLGGRPAALQPPRVAAVNTFLNSLPVATWWNEGARQEALAGLATGERTTVAETLGALFAPRDRGALVAPLRDAFAALRDDPACNGRVAAVGWCMGGGLSARLACAEKMKAAGKDYEPHIYPDAPHAFFNDTRPSFTVNAARDAWARLLTFFAGLPAR